MPAELPIYLDHNATTPIAPEVVDAMLPYLRDHFGNPSSTHPFGRRTHDAVEQARAQVAALLGATAEEIYFTSGGTEASNLAIFGSLAARPDRPHVITSVIEHPATDHPCRHLNDRGHHVDRLPVDAFGQVDTSAIDERLHHKTGLVTVMHANNETGVIQPVSALAARAHAAGALMHTDAAQSLGKIPVLVDEMNVDLLTIAGHKLYAPKGVGALYVKRGTPLRPYLRGAGHERGLRPGTENVASIVGLGAACELAQASLETEATRVRRLRDQLWAHLQAHIPNVAVNGHFEDRLPNTLSVRLPRVSGNTVLAETPQIAASTGSACHEDGEAASTVITAMGIDPQDALGTLRLTLGRLSTENHIDEAGTHLVNTWRRLT